MITQLQWFLLKFYYFAWFEYKDQYIIIKIFKFVKTFKSVKEFVSGLFYKLQKKV